MKPAYYKAVRKEGRKEKHQWNVYTSAHVHSSCMTRVGMHGYVLLAVAVPTNPSHLMTSSTTSALRYEPIKTLVAKQQPTNIHSYIQVHMHTLMHIHTPTHHTPPTPGVNRYDTLRRVIPGVIHYSRHRVPVQTVCRLQEAHHLTAASGWVKPRLHSLLAIEDSRHAVVYVGKCGVGINCDNGVGEERISLQW